MIAQALSDAKRPLVMEHLTKEHLAYMARLLAQMKSRAQETRLAGITRPLRSHKIS